MSPRLRRPREKPPEPAITWLWSTARSGSGLLLNLLSHPLRPDPSAVLGFGPPPPAATSSPGVLPIDELCLGAHLAPWPGDVVAVGDRLVPGTLPTMNEGRAPYLFSSPATGSWREPLRALVNARVDHARTLGASHVRDLDFDVPVVVKEATSSHAADRVADLMPESKAIVVVRDPRDVACSLLAEPDSFERPEAISDAEERRAVVAAAAERWAMAVDGFEVALTRLPEGAVLQTTLEDLLDQPEQVLERALDLIGLSRDPSAVYEAIAMDRWLQPGAETTSIPVDLRTPTGSWREQLSNEEAAEVERIVGSRLAALGYESG